MENIKFVPHSPIERIRKIASQWLVGQDPDGVSAMHEIAAVLIEPPVMVLNLPACRTDDIKTFKRYWYSAVGGIEPGGCATSQELERLKAAAREAEDPGSPLNQKASCWDGVVSLLNDLVPGWDDSEGPDSLFNEAIRAIRKMAENTIQLAPSRANRVYLAGPMTGYDDYNFPAFNAEAARLRATGLDVVNPAEHGVVEGAEWGDYLRYDIAKLAMCEAIHFLPGWEASKGAQLEMSVAKALGMAVSYSDRASVNPPSPTQTEAVIDVLAERRRQVEKEGWTPEHDDEHDDCSLAAAAACYATCANGDYYNLNYSGAQVWPARWLFKDGTYRQNLVKAGALVLAEIERIDRAEAKAEARVDVIGQNGNTGEHYAELAEFAIQQGGKPVEELPDGLTWAQAPEWADQLGLTSDAEEAFHVWFNEEQYQYVDQRIPFRFGDRSAFARNRDEVTTIATRPSPVAAGPRLDPADGEACDAAFHNEYHKVPALVGRIEWDKRWKEGVAPPQLRAAGWIEWHADQCLTRPDKATAAMFRNGRTAEAEAGCFLALNWSPMSDSFRRHEIIAYRVASQDADQSRDGTQG